MDSTARTMPNVDESRQQQQAELSTFSSPFDNFFNYVPKEHEVAVRQALFNAAAITATIFIVVGSVYVFFILEPFVMPLFWAVLTGVVLHPYKTSMADWLRDMLLTLRDSDSPASLASIRLVSDWFIGASEVIGNFIFKTLKYLLIATGIFVAVYVFASTRPKSQTAFEFPNLSFLWSFNPLSLLSGVTIWHITALGLCLLVSLLFSPRAREHLLLMKLGFLSFWLLIAGYISNLVWTPVSFSIFIITIYATFLRGLSGDGTRNSSFLYDSMKGLFRKFLSNFITIHSEDVDHGVENQRGKQKVTEDVIEEETNVTQPLPDIDGKSRARQLIPSSSSTPLTSKPKSKETEMITHPGVSALRKQHGETPSMIGTPTNRSQFGNTTRRFRKMPFRYMHRFRSPNVGAQVESMIFVRGSLMCCIVVQFYTRPSLLLLLPIPILLYLVKHILSYCNFLTIIKNYISQITKIISEWIRTNCDTLFPYPVQKLFGLYMDWEKKALEKLPKCADSLVTIFLIIFMIIAIVVAGVVISLELYAETVHMVQMSGKMVSQFANSTAFLQANQTFWDPVTRSNVENFIESAYHSGRDFISSSIKQLLDNANDQESAEEIELKILELWDRIYQYWIVRRSDGVEGPDVDKNAVSTSLDDLVTALAKEKAFEWSWVAQFCRENMGTFVSIIDSTWTLLKGNFGLVMGLLFELIRLVLLSSSSVVNFILSIVIYFTALYYLLVNSGKNYLPVEVISSYGWTFFVNGSGTALDRAVTSIFWLTFKMVTFYGSWTYLTHTVFNASIVTVPILAAAFLAAVPIAGQYIVPIPAALELWLAKGRPVSAILLIACHLFPTFFVDQAIYAEVKGGIHPWITGLSIVGGIYYFGIAGAIYGPLVLCLVIVILSMYPNALSSLQIENSRFATPILRRADTVY